MNQTTANNGNGMMTNVIPDYFVYVLMVNQERNRGNPWDNQVAEMK